MLKYIKIFIEKAKNTSSNLMKRIVSALILIPIVVYALYSNTLFNVLLVLITILMSFEWMDITKTAKEDKKRFWMITGIAYIFLPIASLLYIKSMSNGSDIILWLLFTIWSVDIAAYFIGKNIGGPKLAPKISPNKTYSGLIGGIVASVIIAVISSFMFKGGITFFVVLGGLLALVEQISDLIESKIKRHFGVKDSGNLIPGHGGILDRVDGFILVSPLILIITVLFKGSFS